MRLLLELAVFLAAPAPAPEGLPLWLAGTWCPAWRVEAPVEEQIRHDPWLGEQCMTWAVKDGAMRASSGSPNSGRNDSFTFMRVEVSGGRLAYRFWVDEGYRRRNPARGYRLREVSRRANQIEFAGGRRRARFVRDGDVLTVEYTTDGEPPSVQRFRRER